MWSGLMPASTGVPEGVTHTANGAPSFPPTWILRKDLAHPSPSGRLLEFAQGDTGGLLADKTGIRTYQHLLYPLVMRVCIVRMSA